MAVTKHEIVGSPWRDYDFDGRVYRIERPVALYTAKNGVTHRVEDASGVIHIVPAPGFNGCVIRYAKDDGVEKVTF